MATPWKTLSKLNAFFINLKPGDSVLFQRGDIFRGTIVATASGSKANPIVLSAYGMGTLPTITLPLITGWEINIHGIYYIKKQMWPAISIFYEDGKPLLQKASTSDCNDGKWWCDNSSLYYKPASGKASDHEITIANIIPVGGYEPGLDLSNCSYITVAALEFDALGIGIKTFDTFGGTIGLTIQNCVFHYCQSAIILMPDKGNNTNTTIENCYFYRNQNAVRMYTTEALGGRPGQTWGTNINCTISNNEMAENGTIDGTTIWTYGTDREAIGLQNFSNGEISGNFIHGGSQIGIIFYNLSTRSSDNNLITKNFIIANNRVAITFNGDHSSQGDIADYAFNNNRIVRNQIVNSGDKTQDASIIFYQGANTKDMNYFINNTLSGKQNVVNIVTSRSPYFSIKNNIFYNLGDAQFIAYEFTTKPITLEMDYNIYFKKDQTSYGWQLSGPGKNHGQMKSLGLELHSKIINPLFIDEASNNFRLQSFSPAIDAGTYVGLPYTGVAPDIGAYEMEFQTLPLQFIDFEGHRAAKAIDLRWQTANETHTDYFEVLKSSDGLHFQSIGRLPSNNQPSLSTYTFTDNKPFAGKNYYQLKQVDKDGKYTFSKVIIVSYSDALSMELSPNPAANQLTVSLNTAPPFQNATLQIRSVAGGLIKQIPINSFFEGIPLDVSTLAKGTYIVSLLYNGTTLNQKFIKH